MKTPRGFPPSTASHGTAGNEKPRGLDLEHFEDDVLIGVLQDQLDPALVLVDHLEGGRWG